MGDCGHSSASSAEHIELAAVRPELVEGHFSTTDALRQAQCERFAQWPL